MYGDGGQTLDLVHSSDAARANILAMFNDNVKNEHFNVGTGIETSLKQVLELIERHLHKKAKVKYIDSDPHLVQRRCASIEKIASMLGFKPTVSIEEGTKKYVQYLLEGKI